MNLMYPHRLIPAPGLPLVRPPRHPAFIVRQLKAIATVSMLLLWTAARAQMLPPDGAVVTSLELDAVLDDSTDEICDLSGAAVIAETEMSFKYFGDTLVRCLAGPRADWLRICNDTIWSLGSDTRRSNIRFRCGLPYLIPMSEAAVSDTLRHCMFMSYDRENLVTFRYGSRRGRGFILEPQDTIGPTYCIETELCGTSGKVRHRRWYAAGAVWPVVEYVTTTVGEEEFTSLHICRPSDQPRPAMYARGNGVPPRKDVFAMLASVHGSDPWPSTSPPQSGDIIVADGTITLSGHGDVDATLRLYDTAGRLWHEGPARTAVPVCHLPAGIYLLHITSGSESRTVKINIAGS